MKLGELVSNREGPVDSLVLNYVLGTLNRELSERKGAKAYFAPRGFEFALAFCSVQANITDHYTTSAPDILMRMFDLYLDVEQMVTEHMFKVHDGGESKWTLDDLQSFRSTLNIYAAETAVKIYGISGDNDWRDAAEYAYESAVQAVEDPLTRALHLRSHADFLFGIAGVRDDLEKALDLQQDAYAYAMKAGDKALASGLLRECRPVQDRLYVTRGGIKFLYNLMFKIDAACIAAELTPYTDHIDLILDRLCREITADFNRTLQIQCLEYVRKLRGTTGHLLEGKDNLLAAKRFIQGARFARRVHDERLANIISGKAVGITRQDTRDAAMNAYSYAKKAVVLSKGLDIDIHAEGLRTLGDNALILYGATDEEFWLGQAREGFAEYLRVAPASGESRNFIDYVQETYDAIRIRRKSKIVDALKQSLGMTNPKRPGAKRKHKLKRHNHRHRGKKP